MRTVGGLLVIVLAGLFVPGQMHAQSECDNACADCPTDPDDWENLGFGVSLWMTWFDPPLGGGCVDHYDCAPWRECRGPEEEEDAKPQEALDEELDELLALDPSQVPDWVRANQEHFDLSVVDGTIQVASRCGAVITWVALEPSQVTTTRALLEQE